VPGFFHSVLATGLPVAGAAGAGAAGAVTAGAVTAGAMGVLEGDALDVSPTGAAALPVLGAGAPMAAVEDVVGVVVSLGGRLAAGIVVLLLVVPVFAGGVQGRGTYTVVPGTVAAGRATSRGASLRRGSLRSGICSPARGITRTVTLSRGWSSARG
jgi:hypothetical protein